MEVPLIVLPFIGYGFLPINTTTPITIMVIGVVVMAIGVVVMVISGVVMEK